VLATAKGLGNGFPIGACLAAGKAAHIFQAGLHGSTFGGSPLACAAGLAVYKALQDENLCANASSMGNYLLQGLQQALQGCTGVVEIRGLGLMIGVELDQPCSKLRDKARALGLLVNIAGGNVIRLVPPLILNKQDADCIITVVNAVVREFYHGR
jgi:acetylornithine aminotransferase